MTTQNRRGGEIAVTMIETEKIDPNEFNPNEMGKEKFAQYRREVERLDKLPKPIVVRATGDRFEVVDGAHALRVAQQLGFTEVPCEVVNADDFEIRLECYKRNRGGRDNPVKLGRMFQEMMKIRKLSARALAKEMGISDGTIGNYINAVRAVEVRNRYAHEDREREIAKLSVRQIQEYLTLPETFADRWLDEGGILSIFDEPFCEKNGLCKVQTKLERVDSAGLIDLVDASILEFRHSLVYALTLVDWLEDHGRMTDSEKLVRSVGELKLPANVLGSLPCTNTDGAVTPLIPPNAWTEILQDAKSRARDRSDLHALVDASVRVRLKETGVNLSSVLDPRVAEQLQIIEGAPDFITAANHLTTQEQFDLHQITADGSDELILAAKEQVVDLLRQRRNKGESVDQEIREFWEGNIESLFYNCLTRLLEQQSRNFEEEIFADRDELINFIVGRLEEFDAIGNGHIGDRPAVEILQDRLAELPDPELQLLGTAALVKKLPERGPRRWLEALGGAVSDLRTET